MKDEKTKGSISSYRKCVVTGRSLLKQFMSLKTSFKFHIQFYLNQKSDENCLTRFKFKELSDCEKHTRRPE